MTLKFLVIFYIALQLFTTGCVTTQAQLVDPLNRDNSTKVIDSRECLIVTSYWHDQPRYDEAYYAACMDKKGYKKITQEGTDYFFFTSWK